MLGFKTLRDLIGHEIVGECLEDQRYAANGNSEQHTTGGLLVWRKADNWTAFTDGYRTWINGPNGLEQRLNTERFPWEADPTSPSAAPALTRDALRNAEYQHYEERVRLKNGLLVKKVSWSDHVSEAWQLHDPIAFGDLDSDGVEDAVVVLSYTGGGSGRFYYLLAVLNDNGAPVHVASYSIGDRIRLNALAIAAGVITVEMTAHDSDDAACCPTQDTVATFRLNGNALEFLSEVPPGQLTATAQREARPTVDPARIDPGLAEAFQELRNAYAEEIDQLYDWFVASGARAQFGSLGESISQFNSSSNLITINEEYRNESPDALAHALIWPLASLRAISERGGSPRSWDECIADRLAAHSAQALWWLRYGVHGKQNPTQLEQWANNNLASYRDKSLGDWVREAYRESCARYGEPTPAPIQVRTGCEIWQVENRIYEFFRPSDTPQGLIDRLVDNLRPLIAYSIALEAAYTAANLAFPDKDGEAISRSLDFCYDATRSPDYALLSRDTIWPYLNREWQEFLNEIAVKGQLFQFYKKVN